MSKFIMEEKKLSQREVSYWSKIFNTHLMIGTEIEVEFNEGNNYETLRRNIPRTGTFRRFGEGIENIKSDGSLRSGAEILTPGRNIYGFLEQYSMFNNIVNKIEEYEPYISPRASFHNHILLDYDGIDKMEMSMPEIIFKNVLSLCKLFMPAMCYVSSTLLKDRGGLTRYDSFCDIRRIRDVNLNDDISTIYGNFDDRYNALNINNISYNYNGLNRFHVEFRFPDCSLFPAQQASLNILWKAIVMKAIKLSEFGVFDCTDLYNEYDVYKLYNFKNSDDNNYNVSSTCDDIANNSSSGRTSRDLLPQYKEKMVKLSKFMIDFFENDIISIDELALVILRKLSITPVSVISREIDSNNYQDINIELDSLLNGLIQSSDNSLEPLSKIITLSEVKNCSMEEWYERVGTMIAGTEPLQDMVSRLSKIKKLKFSERTGFYYEV